MMGFVDRVDGAFVEELLGQIPFEADRATGAPGRS
jgi:hypothetical protein